MEIGCNAVKEYLNGERESKWYKDIFMKEAAIWLILLAENFDNVFGFINSNDKPTKSSFIESH